MRRAILREIRFHAIVGTDASQLPREGSMRTEKPNRALYFLSLFLMCIDIHHAPPTGAFSLSVSREQGIDISCVYDIMCLSFVVAHPGHFPELRRRNAAP